MSLLSGSPHSEHCPNCQSDLQSQAGKGETLDFCRKCRFPLMMVANKYRLVSKLTEGGFAILYGAEHIHLERDARRVIKVIKPEYLSNENMRARFVREVQVTSALSQRNNHIVRIYDDFGEIANLGYFYIMEHLEGQPLNEMLDDVNGLLPIDLCYHLFLQLCDAMREAHETSIVHRDLKPHNIFIIEQGRDNNFLKVIDFGIAKPIGNQQEQVQVTQGILGTPAYMSPEQCINKNVGLGSDIYAMGSILYELLVGETPFVPRDPKKQEDLSVMEIMSAHLNTPPPTLHSKQPPGRNFPWGLEEIIQKALAKRPEDRYQSVEEMEDAFFQVLPEFAPKSGYGTGSHAATNSLQDEGSPGDTVFEIPKVNQGFLASQQGNLGQASLDNSLFASNEDFDAAFEFLEDSSELAAPAKGADPWRDQIDLSLRHSEFDSVASLTPPASQRDFKRKVIEIDRRQEPQRQVSAPSSSSLPAAKKPSTPSSSALPGAPVVERNPNSGRHRANERNLKPSRSPQNATAPPTPSGSFHQPSQISGPSPQRRARQPRSNIRSALREPVQRSQKSNPYFWFFVICALSALLLFLTRNTWQSWILEHPPSSQKPPSQRMELPALPQTTKNSEESNKQNDNVNEI